MAKEAAEKVLALGKGGAFSPAAKLEWNRTKVKLVSHPQIVTWDP